MLNGLNPECLVGETAIVLYEIRSTHAFFQRCDEVRIIAVERDGYRVSRMYPSETYYLDKTLIMKKSYWNELRRSILSDAVRLITE